MELLADLKIFGMAAAFLFLAAAAALALRAVLFRLLLVLLRRSSPRVERTILKPARLPAALTLFLWLAELALPLAVLPAAWDRAALQHVLLVANIFVLGWLAAASVYIGGDLINHHYTIDNPDNFYARKIQTQIVVIRRLLSGFIALLSLAFILMTFPSIRNLGAGLFASAGVLGLIAGMAARPVLSNVIAGLQIALTQPIRIDDVVIVEDEWGWIEEIHGTYVVVRIWDLRRLVVPISYFIEKPFQNWTRRTADILGTVFFYVDYTVPVAAVREELHRVLAASGLWDGKVWNLQVTNTSERAVELRALMSAPNSPQAWDLRCHVRERLLAYLQREFPESLPKARLEMRPGAPRAAEAAPKTGG